MEFTVSRRTDLALRALGVLADAATRLGAEQIAESTGTTQPYLPHVMGPLTKAGWVESTRGPNGGYELSVPLSEISVLEVIEAEEGPMDPQRCVLRGGLCEIPKPCAIHKPWASARKALMAELAAATVASITDQGATAT